MIDEQEETAVTEKGANTEISRDYLNQLLDALGNSTRRSILRKMAKFPRLGIHPEDLVHDLGVSRQGIMKHLKILHQLDLIEPIEVESPHQGLMRTNFRLKKNLSVSFDISANYFNIQPMCENPKEARIIQESNTQEISPEMLLPLKMDPTTPREDLEQVFKAISGKLSEIEQKLQTLEFERQNLIHEKAALLNQARQLARLVHLSTRKWEILSTILGNWRHMTTTNDTFEWIFSEIFDDRLRADRKDSFMRDIEAIFKELQARFGFFDI